MPGFAKFVPVKPCDATDFDFWDELPNSDFSGSAGNVHSEAVLLTPANFAEIKARIAVCSSFEQFAGWSQEESGLFVGEFVGGSQTQSLIQVLPRGTMLLASKICAADVEDRDAAIVACSAISNVPASALTSQMLENAFAANCLYQDSYSSWPYSSWQKRESGNRKRIKDSSRCFHRFESELEDIRQDIRDMRPFSVKHIVQMNVWNMRGDLVATSPGGGVPVDFLLGGRRSVGDCDESPLEHPSFFVDEVFCAALRPAQCQLQYEMFCIQLERVGRQDLVPSIIQNGIGNLEDTDIELRVPIGRTEAVEIDFDSHGGAAKSDNDPGEDGICVDVALKSRLYWDSAIDWYASIKCATAGGVRYFSLAEVSVCPASSGRVMLCKNKEDPRSKTTMGTGRITFASVAECAAAVKTIHDLQSILAPDEATRAGIVEALVSRFPQYESTHAILSVPLKKLAFVLDMGEKSSAVALGTHFYKTVDMVNGAEYRAYHGFEAGAGDTLQYELYVSVKQD